MERMEHRWLVQSSQTTVDLGLTGSLWKHMENRHHIDTVPWFPVTKSRHFHESVLQENFGLKSKLTLPLVVASFWDEHPRALCITIRRRDLSNYCQGESI